MEDVKVWVEKVVIPTYEIGEAEKKPMFLEKRVYQGSSGKVYPYPTIEKISDVKVDKEYEAVYLENEYLKIMVLPELGGRIQRAYDKTNGYDFVYYNHVIKPALVGLVGPWISGGIEFNWPQHHRPTTFLPVDYTIVENEDGSKSMIVNDVDQMYGTKGLVKFTLYKGKSYLEITGQLYNRTSTPQTFLWWANPAVAVNDNTQSIFPPDVHAVMDHGKRDVSSFPIATGMYYKQDYSEGVDISRYKNIPVPTSYMAEKSKYDFVGGYDYGKRAGILHVADHHISPGKKQWTWGCGDFGKAWDRNLTDADGPYVELMTGIFTDNQPDFTWLKPFEEKTFKQYFMPYKEVGQVKNATIEAAVNLAYEGENVTLIVYATAVYENASVIIKYNNEEIFNESVKISPRDILRKTIKVGEIREENLKVTVYDGTRELVSYEPEEIKIEKMPEPAKAVLEPEKIMTNEELYFTGLHLEQYRHATYLPDPYYLEGLKRDKGDVRINNAYGSLLMRRGNFEEAEKHFRKALERLIERNPNPYNSETYYLLGLVLMYQGKDAEAYDAFFKATWSSEQQEMSYYYLAVIDSRKGSWLKALEHVEKSLVKNMHNIKARGLKAYLLRKLLKKEAARDLLIENLELDPFDFVSSNELIILGGNNLAERIKLNKRMRNFQENYLMVARDYGEFGAYEEAIEVLNECTKKYPMLRYYEAYYLSKLSNDYKKVLEAGEECIPDYCFPNKLEDIDVLTFAIKEGCTRRAPYYLGNLLYDKMQWQAAIRLWEIARDAEENFSIVHRNLSIAYYNKLEDKERARVEMEKAFALDTSDVRIFLELDQLYKKLNMSLEERLANYEAHIELVDQRDDLYIEYVTLVNVCGNHQKAYDCIMSHKFHPWEGGEGKVTTQYTLTLLELAREAMAAEEYNNAEELLKSSLVYPENLGEGKLEGTKDNHLYYYLGLALEAQGKVAEAKECFVKATLGSMEPASVMFYNDQPADMILYQGLAHKKLAEIREANGKFYKLIKYGEEHLLDEVKVDYFAVSLPDFLIFNENYTLKNHVHCLYLMALGNIGLGNNKKAKELLKKAKELEPSHIMCNVYSDL